MVFLRKFVQLKNKQMIEKIFQSVRSYSSRSRNSEEWNMVFSHLHTALLSINSQKDIESFKKHFYSYIENRLFFQEHQISIIIQSILNQELHVFDGRAGIDSFAEKHELFSAMVEETVEKERDEDDREWEEICVHAKEGGLWPPLFYLS